MKEDDVYMKVAEKFEYLSSTNFLEYLKILFMPEEGKFLLEILAPTTCQQLAERLKVDEKSLYTKLEALRCRRLLFKGETEYIFDIGMIIPPSLGNKKTFFTVLSVTYRPPVGLAVAPSSN